MRGNSEINYTLEILPKDIKTNCPPLILGRLKYCKGLAKNFTMPLLAINQTGGRILSYEYRQKDETF